MNGRTGVPGPVSFHCCDCQEMEEAREDSEPWLDSPAVSSGLWAPPTAISIRASCLFLHLWGVWVISGSRLRVGIFL